MRAVEAFAQVLAGVDDDERLVGRVLTFAWVGRIQAQRSGKRPQRLTPRQHEVLELLAHGYSTARIPAELIIADETARNHIRLLGWL